MATCGKSVFYSPAEVLTDAKSELIADTEKKLEAFDRDIAEYTAKLRNDGEDKESLEEILRATREDREILLQSLYDLDPQRKIKDEILQKKKYTREKAIEELVHTEKNYLRDIRITYECLSENRQSSGTKIIDIDFLMGNLDKVVEVSSQMSDSLEIEFKKDFEYQRIGYVFTRLEKDLRTVYTENCTNHENVIMLLEKYGNEPSSKAILADLQKIMSNHPMADPSTLYTLSSVLAKPFQRILKYKLLLGNILTSTEKTHCDFQGLLDSIEVMSGITTDINEKKRGKDLVKKYRRSTDGSLADKVLKMSVHSTIKKINRFSQRVVGGFIQDEQFNREEARLNSLQRLLASFSQGVSSYLRQLHEVIRTQETFALDINEFYAEKSSEVEKFSQLHARIGSLLLEDFRTKTNERVLQPINTLLTMFLAPIKLIKKRRDKLCDYETERTKSDENSEAGEDALNLAKKNYEALNAQLLSEMPKLCSMSEDTLKLCCMIFLRLQSKFYNDCLKTMYELLPLNDIVGDSTNFAQSHSAVLDTINQISFVPKDQGIFKKTKNRKSDVGSSSPLTVISEIRQTDQDRATILEKYNDVWVISTPTTASNCSELALASGALVGVIKNFDPSGSSNKWFVDSGSAKGLVPSANLVKHVTEEKLIDTSSSFPGNLSTPEVVHTHKAVYDFQARNELEVTINSGDCVEVLQTTDSRGNSQWWYVKKEDGSAGYVPANYLYKNA
ncbi:DgyrCDS12145 [Dimorphilus gyrociliatus]|uniref:Dynamin-binding protein n=1 Tax=Dimorphilus gyrociliatus TaxID=2664684 RepID=A0A7I8W5J3_9ANNE|nr:DgyrCDS12145 [Dimorphilus gyrociliatus]